MAKKKQMSASDAGKKGGQTTLKKLGREHYQKIALASWKKRKAVAKKK